MGRRNEPAAALDLFGGPVPARPGPAANAAHPLAPWVDAIAEVIGRTQANQHRGRVARIAKAMRDAHLSPTEFKTRIVDVVRRYAAWRGVIDVTAVQCCWGWIVEPPRTVEEAPRPAQLVGDVMRYARPA